MKVLEISFETPGVTFPVQNSLTASQLINHCYYVFTQYQTLLLEFKTTDKIKLMTRDDDDLQLSSK